MRKPIGEILFLDNYLRDTVQWRHLSDTARQFCQRENRTIHERRLERALREFCGWSERDGDFVTQWMCGEFFADFMFPVKSGDIFRFLVVEVDGAIHGQEMHPLYDAERTRFFEREGGRELRITNDQVDTDPEAQCRRIAAAVAELEEKTAAIYTNAERLRGKEPVEASRPVPTLQAPSQPAPERGTGTPWRPVVAAIIEAGEDAGRLKAGQMTTKTNQIDKQVAAKKLYAYFNEVTRREGRPAPRELNRLINRMRLPLRITGGDLDAAMTLMRGAVNEAADEITNVQLCKHIFDGDRMLWRWWALASPRTKQIAQREIEKKTGKLKEQYRKKTQAPTARQHVN